MGGNHDEKVRGGSRTRGTAGCTAPSARVGPHASNCRSAPAPRAVHSLRPLTLLVHGARCAGARRARGLPAQVQARRGDGGAAAQGGSGARDALHPRRRRLAAPAAAASPAAASTLPRMVPSRATRMLLKCQPVHSVRSAPLRLLHCCATGAISGRAPRMSAARAAARRGAAADL